MRSVFLFFFNDTATTEIYTLSLHDALPISLARASEARSSPWLTKPRALSPAWLASFSPPPRILRSEEHTSELQSRLHLVCRLLLEKKKHKRSGCIPRHRSPKHGSPARTRFT